MLKTSVEIFNNNGEQDYYLLNIVTEEITFSIPLNTDEFLIVESCLESVLYQSIEDISLEMCSVKANKKRNMVTIRFTNYVPIMSFTLQRSEAITLLHRIKELLLS